MIGASFGSRRDDIFEATLRSVLHELHLVSLKANFELFLNRLLSTMWTFYFADLSHTISAGESVPLRELAESFERVAEPGAGARDLVIDRIIPVHGLHRFESALKQAANIQLRDVLNHKDYRSWPQIYTAFEVRHLVEHRDGKVDNGFRERLRAVWSNSSWGVRESLQHLKKIAVEEEDVIQTYTAMLEATGLFTEAVLRWSSHRLDEQAPHE